MLAAGDVAATDIADAPAIAAAHAGLPVFHAIRDRMPGGHVACFITPVRGLAGPDWKVGIAVWAARVDQGIRRGA